MIVLHNEQPVEFLKMSYASVNSMLLLTLDGKKCVERSKQGGWEMETKGGKFAVLKGMGLRWWLSGEESASQCRRRGFDP